MLVGSSNRFDRRRRRCGGFSLVEVTISLGIIAIVVVGMVDGYRLAGYRTEWSAYSTAGQALALQQIEQIRAAKWDTQQDPIVDDTANVPTTSWAMLDMPVSGTNAVYATNFVSVADISVGNGVSFKQIQVDTVWPWRGRLFTNTLVTFRAPDR